MSDDVLLDLRELREQVRAARLRLADSAAELGTLLRLRGDHAEAERLLRQAVEIYEDDRRNRTQPITAPPITAPRITAQPITAPAHHGTEEPA